SRLSEAGRAFLALTNALLFKLAAELLKVPRQRRNLGLSLLVHKSRDSRRRPLRAVLQGSQAESIRELLIHLDRPFRLLLSMRLCDNGLDVLATQGLCDCRCPPGKWPRRMRYGSNQGR